VNTTHTCYENTLINSAICTKQGEKHAEKSIQKIYLKPVDSSCCVRRINDYDNDDDDQNDDEVEYSYAPDLHMTFKTILTN